MLLKFKHLTMGKLSRVYGIYTYIYILQIEHECCKIFVYKPWENQYFKIKYLEH